MKKIILLLLLLVTGALNAQIVNIPDADFKDYLVYRTDVDINGDGEIQITEAQATHTLSINFNNDPWMPEYLNFDMTGLEAFVNLTYLNLSLNNTYQYPLDFDLSLFTQLEIFHTTATRFSNINLSTVTDLEEFKASGCRLPALDFSNQSNLISIDISLGVLPSLNIGSNINFKKLRLIEPDPITNIDLSGCPNLNDFYLYYSINLFQGTVYVNLKNGTTNSNGQQKIIYSSANNQDLSSVWCRICIDEGENLAYISTTDSRNKFSTYCTFMTGGNHNTIAGSMLFDIDNNGCNASDINMPFSSVQINDGTTTGYSYVNDNTFNFYLQAGTFALTPQFENDWFTASPATVTFADNNNNTATQNFCVTANGVHNDAEVVVVPIESAQPGFDATYKLIYKNKGNQPLSGYITFIFDDAVLDYVSATPAETGSATGSLTWSYSNLLPFESREILLTLNVNSPMETPAVNIDDVLNLVAIINPVGGDETTTDNTFYYNQTVIGSFDPNDITCLEGATVSADKIGDYLHYNINFENTGTAPASFVVVKDIIDETKFDVNSLVVLNASHAVQTRVTGNKLEFYFDDINLAANGGKGNVTFKIKSLETLAVNSSVTQQADIFFDYNWPIETNVATTTYAVLNTPDLTKDASVKVYPNPAKNTVNISAESAIQNLQLFDVQGRLLEATSVNDISATLDIASRANGIYFIKVSTEKGVNVEKIVKE